MHALFTFILTVALFVEISIALICDKIGIIPYCHVHIWGLGSCTARGLQEYTQRLPKSACRLLESAYGLLESACGLLGTPGSCTGSRRLHAAPGVCMQAPGDSRILHRLWRLQCSYEVVRYCMHEIVRMLRANHLHELSMLLG